MSPPLIHQFAKNDGHLLITDLHRGFCSSWPCLSVRVQKGPLSQHEKYCKALVLTSELASVASGASQFHFDRQLNLIQELIDHWKCGEEVGLVDLNEAECKCQS